MWPFKKEKGEKEDVELPELPELPPLPETLESRNFSSPEFRKNRIKDELPPIPSFKTVSSEKPLPIEFQESRIEPQKMMHKMDKPGLKKEIYSREEEPLLGVTRKTRTRELGRGEEDGIEEPMELREERITTEPIFVRIDKYEEALTKFRDIKKRIVEIEEALREVREVRRKEEAELEKWEEEIQATKSKLNNIDKNIFGKLE